MSGECSCVCVWCDGRPFSVRVVYIVPLEGPHDPIEASRLRCKISDHFLIEAAVLMRLRLAFEILAEVILFSVVECWNFMA